MCPLSHLLALQSPLEEAQEGGQAEAVHVVDLRQVGDDKIHLAGALGQRQVGVPLLEWRGEKKRGTRQKSSSEKQREEKTHSYCCSDKSKTNERIIKNGTERRLEKKDKC